MLTFRSSALALAVLGVVAAAGAATVSYTDLQTLPNDTDTTLSFHKFNTSLGTLTGVHLQIGIALTGAQVELDNDAAIAQTGTARVLNSDTSVTSSATMLKTDFSSFGTGALGINASHAFGLAATTGDTVGAFNATGLGDYAKWQPGTLTASDSGDIANFVWSGYQGSGDFTVTTHALYLTSATFDGSQGFFQGNTPSGTFSGMVTYTYTPVPEPTVAGVIATGAVSVLGLRKRNKKA